MRSVQTLALGALLMGSAAARAQPAAPAPVLVRGTVVGVAPGSVTLTSRDGRSVTLNLTKDWTAQVTKFVTVAQIQTGSFIGTAEMPQADGVGRSLEVHVFPPGVKMGEGHYGWDLQKGSMMTNGTVGKVLSSPSGQAFDVSYATGVRHIVVPPGTPIVQIVPSDRGLVRPGVKVFAVAFQTPKGLVSNSIAVGEGDKAPPM